ncbi:MAG: CopD family protein [Burkholderiales bacterium]|nr:CopD family protein [Burkholderiales bacterium]
MDIARFIHVLGIVIWVGGMFFAYVALRPVAAAVLQPPERLRLWEATFRRFFTWVWVAVAGILTSGVWMILLMGGFGRMPPHVHVMFAVGVIMMLIFAHVYFAPYGRLKRLVSAQDWAAAAAALGQIRNLVGINLMLGLITVAVGTAGRLLA